MPEDDAVTTFMVGDGYVSVGGRRCKCVQAEMHYALNGIPFAVFNLVPDVERLIPETFFDVYAAVAGAEIGDVVTASFVVTGKTQKHQADLGNEVPIPVWRGIFTGMGVLGSTGGGYCQVWSAHPVAVLDDTPALSLPVHGQGAQDFSILVERLHPAEAYSGTPDLWGDVALPILQKLYPKASDVLGGIKARPLKIVGAEPFSLVEDVHRCVCFPNGSPLSLWDILIGLAHRYRFFITCIDGEVTLVPGVPTTSSSPAKTLPDGFCSLFQESYKWSRPSVKETTMLPAWDACLFDTHARVLPDAEPPQHKVLAIKAPAWAGGVYREVARTKETSGLGGNAVVAGYSLAAPAASSSNQASGNVNLKGAADAEAAIRLHEKSTQILHMEFNTDFCPGSQLAFTPDQSSLWEGMVNGPAELIGCVKQVSLVLASTTPLTGTWVALSNVRSLSEQRKIPWNRHPMYGSSWVRAPLLQIAGFSLPEEGG